MTASLHVSACDINDFGAPSQPFPPPWLPRGAVSPADSSAACKSWGHTTPRWGHSGKAEQEQLPQLFSSFHSSPRQQRSITPDIPPEPAACTCPGPAAWPRPLQGMLSGGLAPVSHHLPDKGHRGAPWLSIPGNSTAQGRHKPHKPPRLLSREWDHTGQFGMKMEALPSGELTQNSSSFGGGEAPSRMW